MPDSPLVDVINAAHRAVDMEIARQCDGAIALPPKAASDLSLLVSRSLARAALIGVAEAGYAIVPKEPTKEMLVAVGYHHQWPAMLTTWRAMLKAAQEPS